MRLSILYVHDQQKRGRLNVCKIDTKHQVADLLTKLVAWELAVLLLSFLVGQKRRSLVSQWVCQSLCMKVIRIVCIYMRVRDSLLYVCMQTSYLCMCMSAIISAISKLSSKCVGQTMTGTSSERQRVSFSCCCSCLLQFFSKPTSK